MARGALACPADLLSGKIPRTSCSAGRPAGETLRTVCLADRPAGETQKPACPADHLAGETLKPACQADHPAGETLRTACLLGESADPTAQERLDRARPCYAPPAAPSDYRRVHGAGRAFAAPRLAVSAPGLAFPTLCSSRHVSCRNRDTPFNDGRIPRPRCTVSFLESPPGSSRPEGVRRWVRA